MIRGKLGFCAEQLVQVLRIVVPEPDDRRAAPGSEHRAVEDRLVRPAVEEDRPVAGEHRDHRHVDVGDRREQQDVLAPEQLGHPLLDLHVRPRTAEQPRPRGVRAPPIEILGDRGDHVGVEVQTEVVARREVRQPVIADPDPPPLLLVDHRVHHRVRAREPGEIGHRGHPTIEPVIRPTALRRRGLDGCAGGGRRRAGVQRVERSHRPRISAAADAPLTVPARATCDRVRGRLPAFG